MNVDRTFVSADWHLGSGFRTRDRGRGWEAGVCEGLASLPRGSTFVFLGDACDADHERWLAPVGRILCERDVRSIFVVGNHDTEPAAFYRRFFRTVASYFGGSGVVFSHAPLRREDAVRVPASWVNVHGHWHCVSSARYGPDHARTAETSRLVDPDVHGFAPVPLRRILGAKNIARVYPHPGIAHPDVGA